MTSFRLNGREVQVQAPDDTPLLWAIRDELGLTGTKYGCGIGQCGACTVHMDGGAVRSCLLPMAALEGKAITTIEGLAGERLHAVQQAWIDEDVAQCGYCQAGQIMAAVELLAKAPDPDDAAIAELINLCRCGTYPRIRKAIKRAAKTLAGEQA